jgi:hypothetical protein
MSELTRPQYNAYSNLCDFGGPATSKQLGTTVKTMQTLKQKGMVKNVQAFGDDSVLGVEHKNIQWIVDCSAIEPGIRNAMTKNSSEKPDKFQVTFGEDQYKDFKTWQEANNFMEQKPNSTLRVFNANSVEIESLKGGWYIVDTEPPF